MGRFPLVSLLTVSWRLAARRSLPSCRLSPLKLCQAAPNPLLSPGLRLLSVSPTMRYEGIQSNFAFRSSTAAAIRAEAQALIQEGKAIYDKVGAVEKEKVSFSSVVQPLLDCDRESYTRGVALQLPAMVAVEKELRDASSEAEKLLDEFAVEMSMRKDIFDNLVAFSQTEEAKALGPELKRFVEKSVTDGRRNGLHLGEEEREKVKVVKKRISELGTDFNKNLNEDTTFVMLEEGELSGVPADLVKSFERDEEGRCKVTMKYPHFFPVTRKCNNPKTRFLMEKTYQSRLMKENTAIIEEIVALRQEQAQLLGYADHATYIQEIRMAKDPGTVKEFLGGLAAKVKALWEEEQKVMLRMKEEEAKELGFESSGKLDFWDFRYYMAMVEEKQYAVDQEKLKEYFPMEVVTAGLMEIYQRILGLKFTKVEGGEVWHDDVEQWRVDDAASGHTIGYFYLDLYPRDGKYGHACMMQLQPGCLGADGQRQKSVVVMITNFSKPTAEKPSLLDHKEVETYFHEFGHVMHGICSTTDTSRFFGTNVERDFVEAPSQMLENWVWEEESLRLMSRHYRDETPLPKEMLDKLVASRNANAGGFTLRQVFLATFDQRLHSSSGPVDTATLIRDTYREIVGIETIEGTNFAAIFGHLVGYDAQYYGYLWSEVYSQDMFATRFAKEGVLNPGTGGDYRQLVLAPGGSRDGMDLLRSFLGREPSQEAFLRSKGLAL